MTFIGPLHLVRAAPKIGTIFGGRARGFWRIDTVAVKRSDPRTARDEDHRMISLEVLPRSTRYRSEHESLTNQAATGV